MESIEAVNKILEEANKRIQPTGTGTKHLYYVTCFYIISPFNFLMTTYFFILPVELFGALRARLYDSNKNLVAATLTAVGNVASAMGAPVEKFSKVCLLLNWELLTLLSCYFVFKTVEL